MQEQQQDDNGKDLDPKADMEVLPKRPPNAYIIFSQCCRVEFKDLMMPTFDSRLISMVLGHVWRFLSKAERHCFYEEAEKLNKQYNEKKRSLSPVENQNTQKMKKPLNAFMLFCQEQRPELHPKTTALSGQQAAKRMARKWNRMSASNKQVYLKRAALARSLYEEKLKEAREQISHLPITLGGTDEEDTTTIKECKLYNINEPQKSTGTLLQKKTEKNNNKWLTDSDINGSLPNSALVEMLSTSSPCHRASLLKSPLASATHRCNKLITAENRHGKESVWGLECPCTPSTSKPDQPRPLCSPDSDLSSAARSDASDTSLSGRICTKRRNRGKGRVRRASLGGQMNKQVRWTDKFYPWDTFSTVSGVLRDEDICTRLCLPGVLSDTSLCLCKPRASESVYSVLMSGVSGSTGLKSGISESSDLNVKASHYHCIRPNFPGLQGSSSRYESLDVNMAETGCQGVSPKLMEAGFQDAHVKSPNDTSCLQCAATCSPARRCRPASPRKPSPIGGSKSWKAKMEAIFLRPKLELAQCSSSASSDCITCPYPFPTCVSRRAKN